MNGVIFEWAILTFHTGVMLFFKVYHTFHLQKLAILTYNNLNFNLT